MKTTNLPNTGTDIKAGTRCQVIGWGTTNNGINKPSDTLKEVNVTVIDRNTCNDKKHYNLQPAITKNMVCAGDVKGGKDSCSVSTFISSYRLLELKCKTQDILDSTEHYQCLF